MLLSNCCAQSRVTRLRICICNHAAKQCERTQRIQPDGWDSIQLVLPKRAKQLARNPMHLDTTRRSIQSAVSCCS